MSHFLQPSCVNFACCCGLLNPISKLYFCRHCLKLRCGFCVCHEVDSHFCSNCLENIPSAEAKLKKHRCNSCFDCPSCQHTLSARASSVIVPRKEPSPDEKDQSAADTKVITRKMYYLSCLSCRWTSRDVGIPDQTAATGSWPEPEFAHSVRFALLMEHFVGLVLQEKQERQDYMRKKAPKQTKFQSITDRTGLTASLIRRQMGWGEKTNTKVKAPAIEASEAADDVPQLPENIFKHAVNLKNVTTMRQRMAQPANQPSEVTNLYPQHKSLSIKRSLRCRQCEHNVIKSEYNPSSIKYRIQLFASYHIPDVRLIECGTLRPGAASEVIIKLINPTMNDMTMTIMDLPTPEEELLIIEEMRNSFEKNTSISSLSSVAALSRQTSLTEEPRFVKNNVNALVTLPDSTFTLLHRDDTADFDEDVQTPREDPKFVVWRKSNKLAIRLGINVADHVTAGDEVTIGFSMQYTYMNTVTNTPDKKEPQKHALSARVYISLGKVNEA